MIKLRPSSMVRTRWTSLQDLRRLHIVTGSNLVNMQTSLPQIGGYHGLPFPLSDLFFDSYGYKLHWFAHQAATV